MSKKIYIFGATGFVGSNITEKLAKMGLEVSAIHRQDVDFRNSNSLEFMKAKIEKGSVLVLAFAKAPAKDAEDLFLNLSMVHNAIKSIKNISPSYVLNVSSDAVYSDSAEKICEDDLKAPLNFHGIMHAMRENILNEQLGNCVGHIRPTLIFGPDDPHNSYGPNSFLRTARIGENISVFGNGEEQRDHIHVEDVASIACQMVVKRYVGAINAVSGGVTSFHDIASKATKVFDNDIKIVTKPRNGPMPHNGYRAFDNTKLLQFMPNLKCLDILTYLEKQSNGKI